MFSRGSDYRDDSNGCYDERRSAVRSQAFYRHDSNQETEEMSHVDGEEDDRPRCRLGRNGGGSARCGPILWRGAALWLRPVLWLWAVLWLCPALWLWRQYQPGGFAMLGRRPEPP